MTTDANAMPRAPRCLDTNPTFGTRCILPDGHEGPHAVESVVTWDTPTTEVEDLRRRLGRERRVSGETWRLAEEQAKRIETLLAGAVAMADAAEALWAVVANVNQGRWSECPKDWRDAAEQARELYHKAMDIAPLRAEQPAKPVPTIEEFETLHKLLYNLRRAARAVLAQWDTPNWKLTVDTAGLMARLRDALKAADTSLIVKADDARCPELSGFLRCNGPVGHDGPHVCYNPATGSAEEFRGCTTRPVRSGYKVFLTDGHQWSGLDSDFPKNGTACDCGQRVWSPR